MATIDVTTQETKLNGMKSGNIPVDLAAMPETGSSPAGQLFLLKHEVGQILDIALMIQMASNALDCKSERNAFATSAQLIEEHAEKLNADIDRLQKSLSN